MKMTQVTSSNIAAIGYDPSALELHVEFKSGKTFSYTDVFPDEYEELLKANSVGRHFGQFIKSVKEAVEVVDTGPNDSKEAKDLEICKRIAEIEGLSAFMTDFIFGKKLVYMPEGHGGYAPYEPLTDDALCFKLMLKYNVSFWQEGGMFCAKVMSPDFELVRVKNANLAICLVIIKSKA